MVSTTQTTDIAGDTLKISKKTKPIVEDLEIKDAQMIFNTIWTELEQEQGPENLRFPKEIIL